MIQLRLLSFLLGIIFIGFSEPCEFTVARLQYNGGGDWYSNPSSLPNLVTAVKERTDIDICDSVATIKIDDDRLFLFPFIYATGHGNFHLTPDQRVRLRRYLEAGGFFWADDNYGMDKSFRQEMKLLFPENDLTVIPVTHPIFHSKYNLKALPKIHKHDGKKATPLGIFFNNELVVLYTFSSDIGDGMEDLEVHNDGPTLHELALKMGVNIIVWFFKL